MPPIVFGAAALGNVYRVIPEQTKLALCGEWFQQVAPPVFIDAAYADGDGKALEVLGRLLRRLDVSSDEVIIQLSLDSNQSPRDNAQTRYDLVMRCWEKSCRLLGDEYRPKLASVCDAEDVAWRAVCELKNAGQMLGAGIATKNLRALSEFAPAVDWVTLVGGFTLLHHPPDVLEAMSSLADRRIPIVNAGLFHGGFLVGGRCKNGRLVHSDDPADKSLFAWRKAFAALCEGHGVSPAHACIQFAFSAPGVVAVALNSAYPDRVGENVRSVCQKVPDAFWASMKEEGLLAADYPYLGT